MLPTISRVIAVDLIGHGQTEKPNDYTRYNMDEQVEICMKRYFNNWN